MGAQRILSAANSGGPNDAERFRASKLDSQFELGDKLDGQLPDLVPLGSTQTKRRGNFACVAPSADDVVGQRLTN